MQNVIIDIDKSVISYFAHRDCMVGMQYVTAICYFLYTNITENYLKAEIKAYYSRELNGIAINIDFREFLDPGSQMKTKQMIDFFLNTSLQGVEEGLESDCLYKLGSKITLVYSFFGKVVY